VEKFVGHTRIFDGKFATKAIKSGALEKNAASLPERVAMRQQGLRLAPARTGASSKSRDVKLVLSNVGLEMLRWCEVHSNFVLGSPMVTSKGGEVIGAGKLFNPEGVEIRPEVLDFDSKGGDRYAKYVADRSVAGLHLPHELGHREQRDPLWKRTRPATARRGQVGVGRESAHVIECDVHDRPTTTEVEAGKQSQGSHDYTTDGGGDRKMEGE